MIVIARGVTVKSPVTTGEMLVMLLPVITKLAADKP